MWKAAGVFVAIAIIVMLSFGIRVEAETVAWQNPTQYTDGVAIPSAKVSQLSTEVQYKLSPTGAYSPFGTATGGASSFVAPYVTTGGATSYWRLRSISVADNNSTSAWSPDYPFVRAYQLPVVPSGVSVQ